MSVPYQLGVSTFRASAHSRPCSHSEHPKIVRVDDVRLQTINDRTTCCPPYAPIGFACLHLLHPVGGQVAAVVSHAVISGARRASGCAALPARCPPRSAAPWPFPASISCARRPACVPGASRPNRARRRIAPVSAPASLVSRCCRPTSRSGHASGLPLELPGSRHDRSRGERVKSLVEVTDPLFPGRPFGRVATGLRQKVAAWRRLTKELRRSLHRTTP